MAAGFSAGRNFARPFGCHAFYAGKNHPTIGMISPRKCKRRGLVLPLLTLDVELHPVLAGVVTAVETGVSCASYLEIELGVWHGIGMVVKRNSNI
ncbi:MAG: hypothetical protein RO469_04685 [Thermincola sp.]|jgi:hypothetical protein|nr:hypothetical protein [Thermincola sp.]MDT3703805.1 hypothetical protein [Thermincola sp.]